MRTILRLAAALWLLSGCRTPATDFGSRGRLTEPAPVFEALRARAGRIHAVSGEAKLAIEAPEGGGKVTALIAARRPDQLRIDAVTPLGPLSSFAVDGRTFRLADFENRLWVEGPATPASLARVLPFPLCVDELAGLLAGELPLLEGAVPTALVLDDARHAYVLTLAAGGLYQRIVVDPPTLRPLEADVPGQGACGGYTVSFEAFEEPLDWPRVARVRSPDGRRSIELRWRDREADGAVDDASFVLERPEGFSEP